MSEPCQCRDYACADSRCFAVMQITNHHPACPTHRTKPMDDETIIGHLLILLDRERAENATLTARCNRMVATADIKDVEWRPAK